MKTLYFNYNLGALTDQNKIAIRSAAAIPAITYQAQELWQFNIHNGSASVDLSAAVAWSAAIDKDKSTSTTPMCRTLDADIDSSQAASGLISVLFDANTATFLSAVDGKIEPLTIYVELIGYNSNSDPIYCIQFPAYALMRVDPSGGTPPDPVGDYYTKTESDARYARAIGTDDIEITDPTKGYILRTSDGTRGRITLVKDGGILTLNIEEIV